MSTLQELTSTSAQSVFNKKVLSALPQLHPYVKHRIYIGECIGILPKNMYSSSGILDECIIILYSKGFNIEASVNDIKLELFKLVDIFMGELFDTENYHLNSISTDSILKEELSKLGEDYTVDADLDLILNTELSDISYKQDENSHLYLYADKEISMINALEIDRNSVSRSPEIFDKFYSWLPINISNIVDLYVFGKLNFEEIALIKNTTSNRISTIFEKVKKSFRNHLG